MRRQASGLICDPLSRLFRRRRGLLGSAFFAQLTDNLKRSLPCQPALSCATMPAYAMGLDDDRACLLIWCKVLARERSALIVSRHGWPPIPGQHSVCLG